MTGKFQESLILIRIPKHYVLLGGQNESITLTSEKLLKDFIQYVLTFC